MVDVEDIPDCATVNRLIDFPRMGNRSERLVWQNVFEFPDGAGESVVWSKYAPTEADVHRFGCEREAAKRQSKPEMRYGGFIPAVVKAIRKIKTKRGHGFTVAHKPGEGQHHAEISYAPASPLKKTDKIELKFALQQAFGTLVPHFCIDL